MSQTVVQKYRNDPYKALDVRKSTNLIELYGELGRYPLLIHRKFTMVKYCMKSLNSDDVSPPKNIYLKLENDADINITYYGTI